MFRRRRTGPPRDEPQDVRVLLANKREIPCDLIREPEADSEGFAVWLGTVQVADDR